MFEDGWKPLLNGKNLDDWEYRNPERAGWTTTSAVYWPGPGSNQLLAKPGPGDRIAVHSDDKAHKGRDGDLLPHKARLVSNGKRLAQQTVRAQRGVQYAGVSVQALDQPLTAEVHDDDSQVQHAPELELSGGHRFLVQVAARGHDVGAFETPAD